MKKALLLVALLGSGCGAATSPIDAGSTCPDDRADPMVCFADGFDGGCALVDVACCDGAWTCPPSSELRHASELPDAGGVCISLNYGLACP